MFHLCGIAQIGMSPSFDVLYGIAQLSELERSGARPTTAFLWLRNHCELLSGRPVAPHLVDQLITRPCPACWVLWVVVTFVLRLPSTARRRRRGGVSEVAP